MIKKIAFLFALLFFGTPAFGQNTDGYISLYGPPVRVNLSRLPDTGTIYLGDVRTSGSVVTVFTDFKCAPCKSLVSTLRAMDIAVVERPISIISTKDYTAQEYCALQNGPCDISGLEANQKFAKSHGFKAVPVMVRDDGSVMTGSPPRLILESWIRFRWP